MKGSPSLLASVRAWSTAICSLLAMTLVNAGEALPEYRSERSLAGPLAIWGPAPMVALVRNWTAGFHKVQAGVDVAAVLRGSDTAIPGLYSGRADIALLGRENNITDDNGFSRPKQYPPLRFELTTGSLGTPGKSPALVVFVHEDNPLERLTLAQLEAVFGHEHRRGAANIRSWDQLGLDGRWAGQPINLYGFDIETGTGVFFVETVLQGSRKLNWERLQEFRDHQRPDGSVYRAGAQALEALREDPLGMAVSCLCFSAHGVRDLALAAEEGGPYVRATRDTLIARQYPLTRVTYAFVDKPPGQPIDSRAREFLDYVFSQQGQADIVREADYLPLSEEAVAAQRRLLESPEPP